MSRRRAWNTCASRMGCGKEWLSPISCTLPTEVSDLLHDGNQTTAEEANPATDWVSFRLVQFVEPPSSRRVHQCVLEDVGRSSRVRIERGIRASREGLQGERWQGNVGHRDRVPRPTVVCRDISKFAAALVVNVWGFNVFFGIIELEESLEK